MADNNTNPKHLHFYTNKEDAPYEDDEKPYQDTPELKEFREKMRQKIESLTD